MANQNEVFEKEHILIVDDVDENIQLLAEILLGQGYDISPASSGEEALDALKNGTNPDLILLDIMMPGISGIETCRIIKDEPDLKEIPIIFLSAKAEKESIIEGLRAGASDYVTKPFNIDELLARVNAQIQNIRLRKEIMKMNQNLHENILARDRLLSIIGHDLKSPLGSLLGLAQFYLENGRDDLQSLIEFPPIVNKSLTGILNLLANLLSWARLQGGHMKPDPRKVNLLDALQSSIEILEPQASQKGIEISFLNKADEAIIMDANMLETVIRNLVSNAVKFTKNGGKIEINYSRQNGNVELSVRDNGVGMKPEVLENLFKIDVRQQSQGTNKETGTGLGLVLCRDMIIKNEGSIRVESKSGEGTVFFVTFKAAS